MQIDDLKGKHIGIVGFGVEGQAVAEYLQKAGLAYTVFDKESDLVLPENLKPFHIYTGENYLEQLKNVDIIFRSPGVNLGIPELVAAKERGAVITSQIKYFFENSPTKKIIGITGTKGKSTTTKLIYDILQKAAVPSYIGGNFGPTVLSLLDVLNENDTVVLELSSFQLEDLNISPHIAVVLMVMSDHLNYHKTQQKYIEAKANIVKFQTEDDLAVINVNYEASAIIGQLGKAKKYFVQSLSTEDIGQSDPFELYKPEQYLKIDNGIFAEQLHGNVYAVENGNMRLLFNIKDLTVRSFYLVQNLAAAVLVCKLLEVKEEIIIDTVLNFKGLEHRLELVTEREGIKFFNDSISTTTESALAAAKSFSEPVVAILGGSDKKADYKALAANISALKNIKGVILIGEVAQELQNGFIEAGYKGEIATGAKTMQEIFVEIRKIALKGDIVLLSPGSASFGMFKNYKDRGDQFKNLATEYSHEAE